MNTKQDIAWIKCSGIEIKIEQMKKKEQQGVYKAAGKGRPAGLHFDWLLFAFITLVVILLVFAVSL